jgi:hypothetical protein
MDILKSSRAFFLNQSLFIGQRLQGAVIGRHGDLSFSDKVNLKEYRFIVGMEDKVEGHRPPSVLSESKCHPENRPIVPIIR